MAFGRMGDLGRGFGRLGDPLGRSGGGGIPPWVLSGASIDLDFANGRYYGGVLSSLLTVSRASQATDLLPSSASGYAYNTFGNDVLAVSPSVGILIYEARTNVLLNSAVPATQTTASLTTGAYTLWVNGSGSATPSAGTATITGGGAATNGSPNVFTVTVAGTVTITKVGALNAFQCEKGAFGTSLIVTGGATATRAADDLAFAGAALTLLQDTQGTQMAQSIWTGGLNGNHAALITGSANGGFSSYAYSADNSNFAGCVLEGAAALQSAARAFNVGSLDKYISAWQASNYASSLSGAAVTTSASGVGLIASPIYRLGSRSSIYYINSPVPRVTLWSSRLGNALLPGLST